MAEHDAPTQPTEAAEADVHEQRRQATGEDTRDLESGDVQRDPEEPDVPPTEHPRQVPPDVDPADAYEQTRSVEYDEDDYR